MHHHRQVSSQSSLTSAPGFDLFMNERARKAKALMFSVDSLDVRVLVHRGPAARLLRWADEWRLAQQEWQHGDPNPEIELCNVGTFQVLPGSRRYEFSLVNREVCDIRIWNPDRWENSMKAVTGPLFISFRSKFLLFHGISGAYRMLSRIVDRLVDPTPQPGQDPRVLFRVSRVDLAADLQLSSGLTYEDIRTFVTRAQLTEAMNELPQDIAPRSGSPMDNRDPGKASESGVSGEEREKGAQAPVSPPPAGGANIWRPDLFAVNAAPLVPVVQPADVSRVIMRNRVIETIYVGRFGSTQYARIYDKLKACKVQDKPYYFDLWRAAGWDGESPVWRVEFSISGEALREFNYETEDHGFGSERHTFHELKHLARNIQRLWTYYAGGSYTEETRTPKRGLLRVKRTQYGWMRAVDPATATRLKRCDVMAWWSVVQEACGLHEPARRAAPRPRPIVERLMAGARGYVASVVAVLSGVSGDVSGTLAEFLCHISDWGDQAEGQERIARKRALYATDDATESALWRRERMAEGFGS